nr:Ig-like domain-containing protein [Geobacillus sp. ZGt-1]
MNVGKEQRIPVAIEPADATNKTLAWTSSDPSVASVDQNGMVTARKPGTVTITVRATDGSNVQESATITVIVPLERMAFRNPILYMNVGDPLLEVAPELRFIPENATDNKALRSVVTSDDRFVKVVQENGKWYLQAVDVGYAIITATAEVKALDGRDIQAEATVIVRSPSTNQNGGNGGKW